MRLVSLAATAAMTFYQSPAFAAAPQSDYYVETTQVGVGACSFAYPRTNEGETKIAAALVTAAISQGVNLLVNAVADAAKAKTWSATAARNFQAKSGNFPQCVQVARGRFYTTSPHLGPWADTWTGRKEALISNGLFLADTPDFFFEGEITASEDKSALSVRPVYSNFQRPIGTRALRPDPSRGIAVFLAITGPGGDPKLATAPAASLILGHQAPGTVKTYAEPGKTYRSPMESSWFTLTKADTVKPLTISALVTETQDASAYWDFISKVVGDATVKQQLTSQLNTIFVPGAAAAEAATEASAASKAEDTADQKLAAAIAKLDACRTATSGVVTAASDARVALRAYMAADQAVDKASQTGLVTQTQIDQLNLRQPTTLKQACQAVYDGLTI